MFNTKYGSTRTKYGIFNLKYGSPYIDLNRLEKTRIFCISRSVILDPRSQRAGSYKIGAVIVNV